MKYYLLILLSFPVFIYSQDSLQLNGIVVYGINHWDGLNDANIESMKKIKMDSLDLVKIENLLNKYRPKKIVIYKSSNNLLFGYADVDNIKTKFTLEAGIIYLDNGKKKFYKVKDKKDIEWIKGCIAKYKNQLSTYKP